MQITIRIGAAHDEVVIDGHTFDRSKLSRREKDAMRSLIMDALYPRKPTRKPRRRKANA